MPSSNASICAALIPGADCLGAASAADKTSALVAPTSEGEPSSLQGALSAAVAELLSCRPTTLVVLSDAEPGDLCLHVAPGSRLELGAGTHAVSLPCNTTLAAALADAAEAASDPDATSATRFPLELDFSLAAFKAPRAKAARESLMQLVYPQLTAGYEPSVLQLSVPLASPAALWEAGAFIGRIAASLGQTLAWLVCGKLSCVTSSQDAPVASCITGALRSADFLPLMMCDHGAILSSEQSVLASLQLVAGAFGPIALQTQVLAQTRLASCKALAPRGTNSCICHVAVATMCPTAKDSTLGSGIVPQRNFLAQWQLAQEERMRQARNAETEYSSLARAACETWVAQGRSYAPPRTVSPLISGAHHGCEVSIYKFGALRGQATHAVATEQNLAYEICAATREAASTGAFGPHIRCDELKYLSYQVRILPEQS